MYFEEDEQYDQDQEDVESQPDAPAASKNVLLDIELLKVAEPNVPDTAKEKDLRACLKCKIILSESQWHKRRNTGCVNCGGDEKPRTTPFFKGSVSLFMPSVSWVARWNGLEGNKPGVYAVSVFDSEQMDGESDIDLAPNTKQKKKRRNHNDGEMLYSDQDADEFYT